jgi:hypothetical protein
VGRPRDAETLADILLGELTPEDSSDDVALVVVKATGQPSA